MHICYRWLSLFVFETEFYTAKNSEKNSIAGADPWLPPASELPPDLLSVLGLFPHQPPRARLMAINAGASAQVGPTAIALAAPATV
jgi:hypothetical protein